MARKRHSDEDVLKLLREIELKLTAGDDVATACRSVVISDATYYNWWKRFGGMGRQRCESPPHVGYACREPDPCVRWNRDHAERPRISRTNASGS